MKRLYKTIFVLIILMIIVIIFGTKNEIVKFWISYLYNLLIVTYSYIFKEKTWVISALISIATLIIMVLFHFSKKNTTVIISNEKPLIDRNKDISEFEFNKEGYQTLSAYLKKERSDVILSIAPGSTSILMGDILENDELFIHLPWGYYHGKIQSEELISYLTQVISQKKQILILGDAGQGKTIVMRRVFTQIADRFLQKSSDIIPIYISLRDITKFTDINDEPLLPLWKYLSNKQNPLPLSYFQFISLVRKNCIIFLFDGFDEINGVISQHSINERVSSDMFSKLSILSCRKSFYEHYLSVSAIQQNYLEKIELLPLDFETNTKKYVEKFCSKKGVESNKVIKRIQGSKKLLDLAKRPLLLIMILDIFTDSEEILEIEWNTAKLYEVYTEKWLKNEAMKPDSSLRWHEKEELIEEITWSMYQEEAPSSYSYSEKFYRNIIFTRTDLNNYIKPNVFRYQHIPFTQLVDDICLRTFLISSQGDYYYFIHKSFQEYYVAKYILRNMRINAENTSQVLQESTPSEVATFLEDMLNAKKLSDRDIEKIEKNLINAYKQNHSDDLRSLIIREHASYYLAHLKTNKAIQFLEQVLEEEQNKWVKRGIIMGLGISCGKIDLLDKYIDTLHNDPEAVSINVGYNLVYYGDQALEDGYIDKGGVKCDGTVRAIFRHLKSEKYKAIWVLDLFTLRVLLEDESRGKSILYTKDEYIPFLKEFVIKDHKNVSEIFVHEANLLLDLINKILTESIHPNKE